MGAQFCPFDDSSVSESVSSEGKEIMAKSHGNALIAWRQAYQLIQWWSQKNVIPERSAGQVSFWLHEGNMSGKNHSVGSDNFEMIASPNVHQLCQGLDCVSR